MFLVAELVKADVFVVDLKICLHLSPLMISKGQIDEDDEEEELPFSEVLNLSPMAASIWTALAAVSLVFYLLRAWLLRKNIPLPPGPTGFPILGSLHLLGKDVHRDLHRLAQKYGPIMYMKLGLIPTVVVSSPQAAELFLKTHDLVFASRPSVEAAQFIAYGQNNISYCKYGSYWRDARKMCTLELLSNLKINSFRSMREQELDLLIQEIEAAARERASIDVSSKVASLSSDMTCLMVFGKKYEEKEFSERGFKAVIQEGMQLAVKPNLGDYIPPIAPLDLQGLRRRMKSVSKVFDSFFEKIIDEHIESKNEEKTKDFVDVMLSFMGSEEREYRLDRPQIKAIMLDMLSASSDTSSTAIEWTLSELIRHPLAMKKVQEELEKVVGLDRKVEESDLESLDYLNMAVKETFRLHPVAPLLVPHMSTEDCVVNGFHIPRNSTLMVNAFAIGRDPAVWTEPEKFDPERFAGGEIDVRGRDFRFIPFGSGRRICPGMQLGLTVVRLVVAQLVHCFDWELPDGNLPADLDMTEVYSLVCPRAKPLVAIPTSRLRN